MPRKTQNSTPVTVDETESFEDIQETQHKAEPTDVFTVRGPPALQENTNTITEQFLRQFTVILAQSTQTQQPAPAGRAKTQEPKPFNRLDTRKLHQFLLLCELNFRDRPDAFAEDFSKVNYVLSYLKGTALDYFKPYLVNAEETPEWLEDYVLFSQKLRENFGPHDPEADAESELETL